MPRDVIQIRADDDLRRQVERLADLWGGIRPLPTSQVFREAIRRADEAETPRRRPDGRPRKAGAG